MSYEKARDASAEAQRLLEEFNMKIREFDLNIAKALKEIERDFLEPEYTFWQRLKNRIPKIKK